jgi:hypothetical protein
MRLAQRSPGFNPNAEQQTAVYSDRSITDLRGQIEGMLAWYAVRIVTMTGWWDGEFHNVLVVWEEEENSGQDC